MQSFRGDKHPQDPAALKHQIANLKLVREAKAPALGFWDDGVQGNPVMELVYILRGGLKQAESIRLPTLLSFAECCDAASAARTTLQAAQQEILQLSTSLDLNDLQVAREQLQPLIEVRDDGEDRLRAALRAVTEAFKPQEFQKEEAILRGELGVLQESSPIDRVPNDPGVGASAGTSECKGEGIDCALSFALDQFFGWARKTDPRVKMQSTEQVVETAWRALRTMADSAGENGDAWQGACLAARFAIDAEKKMWDEQCRRGQSMPVQALNNAAATRIQKCNEYLLIFDDARQHARDARFECDELLKMGSLRVNDAGLLEAQERLAGAKKRMKHASRALEDVEEDGGDVATVQAEADAARSALQSEQRSLEEERANLVQLSESHRPELVALIPSVHALRQADDKLMQIVKGRTLTHYGDAVAWPRQDLTPLNSCHAIRLYRFNNELVVLKEYSLSHSSQHRMIQREVEALRKLAHPNIIELQAVFDETQHGSIRAFVQFPLYAGGTLHAWLARKEHVPLTILRDNAISAFDPKDERATLLHLRALRQLLTAIVHVHANGLVHGDIKLVCL